MHVDGMWVLVCVCRVRKKRQFDDASSRTIWSYVYITLKRGEESIKCVYE